MTGVIRSGVTPTTARPLFLLDAICRCFASVATSDPSSTGIVKEQDTSCCRLEIVRIDHEVRSDPKKRGVMRLYSLLDDGTATTTKASVADLGNWSDRDLHMESRALNPVKGLTGSLFSVEAVRGEKRRVLLFDPITRKTLPFLKPWPPNMTARTRRPQEPIYIGRCYQQSSPSAPCGEAVFKAVEIYSIARRKTGRVVGCEICTLGDEGGSGGGGCGNERVERRSVKVAEAELGLGKQTVSLDDSFHGDNILCWGVCRDDNDSWSIRQPIYRSKLRSERYYLYNPDARPKVPIRVGSALVSILSLDLNTEMLKTVPLPPSILQRPNSCNMHLCNLEGCPSICILPKHDKRTGVEVWMFKEGSCFDTMALGDPDSWFLRLSIPGNRLPCGYLGPVALWRDKFFLVHEWIEENHRSKLGLAQRRLVYYDLRSEELCRVLVDGGEDVTMDAGSDILVYEDTLAPIWPGTSVQLTGRERARKEQEELDYMYGRKSKLGT